MTIAEELRAVARDVMNDDIDESSLQEHLLELAKELDNIAESIDDVRYQEYGASGARLGLQLENAAHRLGAVSA